ncbi:MAG: hypothetical protein KAY37_07455 [Phycisphaerae bacterium]|nr:hypothetical protein [Phycisphaerae bacterium]
MRILKLGRGQISRVIGILEDGGPFDVLDKMVHGQEAAAFVLRGHTWLTLGHFDRAASCALRLTGGNEAELRITHLNVPRMWYGVNLFRGSDRKIEDQIRDYILSNVAEATEVD